MKKILTLLFVLAVFISHSQPIPDSGKLNKIASSPWYLNDVRIDGKSQIKFDGNRPITGSVGTGINPSATDLVGFLNNLFYPSQVPTASLSGGENRELMAAGAALNYTLNYSAGRQPSTAPLQSIVVAGVTKSFTQPSAPGSVSGTQAVTVTRNVNTNFSMSVTTTDGKSAGASAGIYWYPSYYYGFVPTQSPTDADILAMTGFLYGGGSVTNSVAAPTGAQSVCFAKPVNTGGFGSIIINTFLQPSSNYNITTRSVTNASGYAQNYYILVFTTTTGGGYSFTAN